MAQNQQWLIWSCRIEPDGQRPRFVLYGTECFKSEHSQCSREDDSTAYDTKGIVYTIDIQDIMNMRSCNHEDYKLWGTGKCVLGTYRQHHFHCLLHSSLWRNTWDFTCLVHKCAMSESTASSGLSMCCCIV